MKQIYIFFILIFALAYIFAIYAASALAADSSFIKGLNTTAGDKGAGYAQQDQAANPMSFLAKMLASALAPMFMGVSGMLSLMYGGYKWMMSRGNEQEVELAKTIIYNTLIALVVAFSAYAIVNLVIRLLVNKTLDI